MSGYARAAHTLGASVTGSDGNATPYSEQLRADRLLEAAIGYRAANLPPGEDLELVHSSAVGPDNPELVAARARGLPIHPRAHLLGELTTQRRTIAVAGTHGKTTTAAMLVHALRAAGLDPGWLVGGAIGPGLANGSWSPGEWLVVEADESDRSMLALDVEIVVLTNVELEHHATYGSLDELREAFELLLGHASGAVVIWERPELLALAASATGDSTTIVPYDLPPLALEGGRARFRWRDHEVALAVPGAHNALNAVGALEAASLAGASERLAIAGLAGFTGAGRRFQALGASARGALLYDDYAHHPTEVEATLRAARALPHERLVAVFQPHLYSRTAMLARELGRALALADLIAVLDVYGARERAEEHPGVSGLTVAAAAADAAEGRPVYWLPDRAEARRALAGILAPGDLCLLMGAGDIDELGRSLVG
jgi:UDP-N-acetylmuramate--alanine ligase